ncbi:MAG TPA: hypothetical protein VGE41_08555, partial [Verrucomicrobiae bacterium]
MVSVVDRAFVKLLCSLVLVIAALEAGAAIYQESFASNPAVHGWKTLGNSNLFRWNATNQYLEVTWDSAQANSFFYLPLST